MRPRGPGTEGYRQLVSAYRHVLYLIRIRGVRYESYIHIFSHIGIPCTISYESKLVMSPDLSNMRTFRLGTSSYVLSAR